MSDIDTISAILKLLSVHSFMFSDLLNQAVSTLLDLLELVQFVLDFALVLLKKI
jgi:hypothetical protein